MFNGMELHVSIQFESHFAICLRLCPYTLGRLAETTVVYPADVVLFEGILVFYNQDIRDMFHLRLFVDTDSDVRLSRRGNTLGFCSIISPRLALWQSSL